MHIRPGYGTGFLTLGRRTASNDQLSGVSAAIAAWAAAIRAIGTLNGEHDT